MRKVLQIISVLLVILMIAEAAAGIYVYNATVHAVNEERRPLEIKVGMLEDRGFDVRGLEEKYNVEEVMISSSSGEHTIPANMLTVPEPKGTVILAHGLNGNRITGYPVAKMLLENGYDILTYDQRNSGESDAVYMTCGLWESRDLLDCVQYIRDTKGPDEVIGAWGASIGGATVGFYMGTDHAEKNLDFAIMDCPVSDMGQIVEHFLTRKADWIPAWMRVNMGSLVTELCLGYSYDEADVCEYVADSSVPLLIFNAGQDTVTPFNMGADLAAAADIELITAEDSEHTDVYWDHPEMYEKEMMKFINSR